jgi:2-amino-4-hydroxy-6-hydroxymethyldihydropteridine diphosphokinase
MTVRHVHAALLLGSNLDDRAALIGEAEKLIETHAGHVVNRSPLYESSPWGFAGQPDFLNRAVVVDTTLGPEPLLASLQDIERRLGRKPAGKWRARRIDIDILLFGSDVIDTPHLKIPHPHLPERRFSLEPLAAVMPQFIHPQLNISISALLQACSDPGLIHPYRAPDPEIA